MCVEKIYRKERVKCPTCKFGALYEQFEDIPKNEALIESMRLLKAVVIKNNKKKRKHYRQAKNLIVPKLVQKLQSERKVIKNAFELSDVSNPYPICAKFFKGKACNNNCKFLHVNELDICEKFGEKSKCKEKGNCRFAHISNE